jgi:hypothetical protein
MKHKEKQFTSYDSQGPTDFDYVGFHLDTIEDLLKLIETINTSLIFNSRGKEIELVPSEKLDELRQYTTKLKRYISDGPIHIHHSETLPKGGMKVKGYSQSLGDDEVNPNDIEMKQYPRN